MKLPVTARDHLRRILAEHPDIGKHCSSRDEVAKFDTAALLRLAEKLGMDSRSIIRRAEQEERWAWSFCEESEKADYRPTMWEPAFTGTIEIDLTLSAFGIECVRKARVNWEWTPEWPYFDLRTKRVVEVLARGGFGLEIWAVPGTEILDMTPAGKWEATKDNPSWIDANWLIRDGVLPSTIREQIEHEIEQRCQAEDQRRRALNGIPGDTA
jgi:hypothetical protein